jgi:hypothetical protein
MGRKAGAVGGVQRRAAAGCLGEQDSHVRDAFGVGRAVGSRMVKGELSVALRVVRAGCRFTPPARYQSQAPGRRQGRTLVFVHRFLRRIP